MTAEVDKTTISTFKGDTCKVTFTGLEEGMVIYFAVTDRKTNELVFDEIKGVVNSQGEVTFIITPEMSNNFEVKITENMNIYHYGIKQVIEETGEENTILLGENSKFSDKYLLKVYLEKVEGLLE